MLVSAKIWCLVVYPSDVGYAAFHTSVGSGYAQQSFRITCRCSFEIDKDKLGALKFVRDLVREDNGVKLNAYLAYAIFCLYSKLSFMQWYDSGTLYTPTNKVDIARARSVKRNILKYEGFTRRIDESQTSDQTSEQQWEDQILVLARYSLNNLKTYAGTYMQDGGGHL